MKTTLFLLMIFTANLHAEAEREHLAPANHEDSGPDPVLVQALTKLENRMGVKFNIPFPANFDIDYWRKAPLAHIEISGRKLAFTRPKVNPFDEPRSIELMIGPEDPAKLLAEGIDCSVSLDERGGFQRLNIIADWASDGTGNHQIERAVDESSEVFFERARLTYQSRTRKAKDAESTLLHLQALVKIATIIQTLAKEEIHSTPGAAAR